MTTFRRLAGSLTCAVVAAAGVMFAFPGTASADPSPDTWALLRHCESRGDYTAVSANGLYFGAYQFDLATWESVGGTGYPEEASPLEQDYRALYLYRMRGWQPWTCATILGLLPDADAASHIVPTLADAELISGTPAPADADSGT